jgi:hypothetical protein
VSFEEKKIAWFSQYSGSKAWEITGTQVFYPSKTPKNKIKKSSKHSLNQARTASHVFYIFLAMLLNRKQKVTRIDSFLLYSWLLIIK